MGIKITKRPATISDTEFARSVHHRAYHDVVIEQFGFWDEALQDIFFVKGWSKETHQIIILNDSPCGYLCVETRQDDIHIREIVIAPEYQNKGIGTFILSEIIEQAKVSQVPVRLGTFHKNKAVRIYQRLGFREFGKTETHILLEWKMSDDRVK